MSDRPYDPMGGQPPQGGGPGPYGPGQPDQGAPGFPQGGNPQQGGYPQQGPGGYPQGGGSPGSYGSAPGSYPSAGQPEQGYPASTGSPSYPPQEQGAYPASTGSPSYPPQDQGAYPASTGSPSYPPQDQGGYPASTGSPSYPPQDQGAYPAAGGPGYPQQGAYGADQGYGATPGYATQAGYGSGGYGSPPPQKSGGKGKLFAIIGGALALVVIAAVVLALTVFRPGGTDPQGNDPTETQQPQTAQGAVQGYLDALAAGDAEKALGFAQQAPSSTTFLTNDFLKAAIEKSPITNINVQEGTGSDAYTRVSATYRVGTKSVSEDFTVKKIGDDWKLDQVAATGSRPNNWGTMPVTINGTLLEGDVITLFPGMYTVGLQNKFVGFENGTLAIDGPSTSIRPYNMTPALNATGKQTIISQARQLLQKCLGLKDMAPNGCGFAVRMPAGVRAVNSTIRWSRTTLQDPFTSATPRLDLTDPGVATMTLGIPVKVNVTGSDGRQYVGNSSIGRAIATINPDKIQVMFQR